VAFLEAFKKPIPSFTTAKAGRSATLAPTAASSTLPTTDQLGKTEPSIHDSVRDTSENKDPRCDTDQKPKTYADIFTGVRQDSGDPAGFVHMMRQFYNSIGIKVGLAE
jgi:nicotinate phosphoribosyltransferase